MNHTPIINTPLEILRDLPNQGNVYLGAKFTRNCGSIQFTDCDPIKFAKIYSVDGTGKDQTTYAEFIVRACNTHEESLEALKGVLHHNDALKNHYKLPNSLVRQIDKAIAKAEGKEYVKT